MSRTKPNAVGAYIFAGLFTIGVRKHFNVLAHLEEGPFGTATARRNFPEIEVHEDPDTWPVKRLRRQGIGLVYCNPPCAPWSNANSATSGNNDKWASDPRTSCFARCFGLLKGLRPKVLCIESVRGAYQKGRPMVESMAEEAMALGYSVDHVLVSGHAMGMTQPRKRYLFVARRVGVDYQPTGKSAITVGEALKAVEDPLGDGCQPFSDRMKWLWSLARPGERLVDAFDREVMEGGAVKPGAAVDELQAGETKPDGSIKDRPGVLYTKIDLTKPGRTLTGSATQCHDKKPRYLSVNEYKALNGVPQDFDMGDGSPSTKYAELCKAVMPPVGDYLGRTFSRAIQDGRAVRRPMPRQVEIKTDEVVKGPPTFSATGKER